MLAIIYLQLHNVCSIFEDKYIVLDFPKSFEDCIIILLILGTTSLTCLICAFRMQQRPHTARAPLFIICILYVSDNSIVRKCKFYVLVCT